MQKFIPRFKHPSDSKPHEIPSNKPSAKVQAKKPLSSRYLFWLGLGIGSSTLAFIAGAWWSLERSMPETKEIVTFVRHETLTIKAADGTVLEQQGPATRNLRKLEEMPTPLIQAFIASEDRRFYQHHGVDYQGIIRALFSNFQARNVVEGGSSITQQLARILFLNQERSFARKLREVRLSQEIEQKLSKEQILERYLNLVYLGQGAYGVADAALTYFSKPVEKLSVAEMALLAGLAPAPNSYSPVVNIEAAKQRRNLVLQRMQQQGFITATEALAAINTPVAVNPSLSPRLSVEAPSFTSYIEKELPKYVPEQQLKVGGLIVETTLNPQWQEVAENVVKDTVERNGRWQDFEQAALVSIDPRTGEVKALVGGKDFGKHQFNRVIQAQRQPGSTFKGFVYTAAVAAGISPYKSYLDSPFKVDGYEPKNFSRHFRGWISMVDALTSSINVVSLKVLLDVGYQPTIQLAHQMGIKSKLGPTSSLALGAWEVNLLELTSAYGTLANQGLHTEVHSIRRILNRNGDVIYNAEYQPKRVLDRGSAAIASWMLRRVVRSGTGVAAQLLDRPVAGKTGTSDKSRDLWFIGYIPQLVTGVWLGNDDNRPTAGSSSTAAATWHQFMVKAVEGMPVEAFPQRPRLEGRKGSIKAQPIKPRRVVSGSIPSDENDARRSKTRRRQQQDQAPTDSRRSKAGDRPSASEPSYWRRRLSPAAPIASPSPAESAPPPAQEQQPAPSPTQQQPVTAPPESPQPKRTRNSADEWAPLTRTRSRH